MNKKAICANVTAEMICRIAFLRGQLPVRRPPLNRHLKHKYYLFFIECIMEEVLKELNQNSVLIEKQKVGHEFYGGQKS